MRDNVDEGDQALDSLFGPYDFLDSGLAQLPQSEPSSGRMSESPEDDKIRGQGVLDAFPDPTAGAMLPPEDRFQPVKSEADRKPGSTDGSEVSSEQAQAPAPKRGRAGAPSGKQLQPPTKGENPRLGPEQILERMGGLPKEVDTGVPLTVSLPLTW